MKLSITLFLFVITNLICLKSYGNLSKKDSLRVELNNSKSEEAKVEKLSKIYDLETSDKKKLELLNQFQALSKNSNKNDIKYIALKYYHKYYQYKVDTPNFKIYRYKIYEIVNQGLSNQNKLDAYCIFISDYIKEKKIDSALLTYNLGKRLIDKYNLHNTKKSISLQIASAYIYFNLNKDSKATNILFKEIPKAISLKDYYNLSSIYFNLGHSYRDIYDIKNAEINFKKALHYSIMSEDSFSIANNCRLLGYVNFSLNNNIKALKYYETALSVFENMQSNIYISDILKEISVIYSLLNNPTKAIETIKKSIKITKDNNFKVGFLSSQNNLGMIYLKNKQYQKAEQVFLGTLNDTNYNVLFNTGDKMMLMSNLAEATYYQKKYIKAFDYIGEAIKLNDVYNNQMLLDKTQEIETKYQTRKKEAEILKLQNKNLKESRVKWILGSILGLSFIGLSIFWILFKKIKSQKDYIEQLQIELHHRIKNNLSIINKFIEDIKYKPSKEMIDLDLTELQNKIESINSVHRQLYCKPGTSEVSLRDYVNSLANNVAKSFDQKIEIQNHVNKDATVSIETIFPLGLIINEFITNSFKHGFKNINNPKVIIDTKIENNRLKQIEISDNGVGYIQKDSQTQSLGIRMMNLLAAQLDASILINTDQGTKLVLNFKI